MPSVGIYTRTLTVRTMSPQVTVMVAEPLPTAVTRPKLLTVATASLEEAKVTVAVAAAELGLTDTEILATSPMASSSLESAASMSETTVDGSGTTVMS